MKSIVVLAACVAISAVASAQIDVSGITFSQVDWYDSTGSLALANSMWGRFAFGYTPNGVQQYMSLIASTTPTGPGVVLAQNVPLVTSGIDPVTEGIDVDLAQLGFANGQAVGQLFFDVSVSATPALSVGFGTRTLASVDTLDRQATDWESESVVPGPLDPGFAAGLLIPGLTAEVAAIIAARRMESVQEDRNHCFAGATARSIKWIAANNGVGFTTDRTAQQIYDALKARGVSRPNDDGTRARERWIREKNAYARALSGNRIETTVWDGGANVDPIAGITEVGGDFATWLKNAIRGGKDVELTYNGPGVAHIVTIAGVYEQGGDTYLLYRDDEAQNDATKGDGVGGARYPQLKRVKLVKDGANYGFGSSAKRVTWALCEAPVPEPATMVALGVGLAALATRRRRR